MVTVYCRIIEQLRRNLRQMVVYNEFLWVSECSPSYMRRCGWFRSSICQKLILSLDNNINQFFFIYWKHWGNQKQIMVLVLSSMWFNFNLLITYIYFFFMCDESNSWFNSLLNGEMKVYYVIQVLKQGINITTVCLSYILELRNQQSNLL